MAAGCDVKRSNIHLLEVRFEGALVEEATLCGEREVRAHLCAANQRVQAVIDLRSVDSYSLQARAGLVRLQSYLAEKAYRTVYVVQHDSTRALGRWVQCMSREQDVRVCDSRVEPCVPSLESDPPNTGIRPLVKARRPDQDAEELAS